MLRGAESSTMPKDSGTKISLICTSNATATVESVTKIYGEKKTELTGNAKIPPISNVIHSNISGKGAQRQYRFSETFMGKQTTFWSAGSAYI